MSTQDLLIPIAILLAALLVLRSRIPTILQRGENPGDSAYVVGP